MASTYAIGADKERRSVELDRKDGWDTFKPTRSRFSWLGNTDIWHLFDYCGRKPRSPFLFVQVKTNRVDTAVLEGLLKAQAEMISLDGNVQFGIVALDVWHKPRSRWVRQRLYAKEMQALLDSRLARRRSKPGPGSPQAG